MRISDWSSDVCSSDLHVGRLARQFQHAVAAAALQQDMEFAVIGRHRGRIVHHPFGGGDIGVERSEEHTSELQSLTRISYAVFCLKKKKNYTYTQKPISPSYNMHTTNAL